MIVFSNGDETRSLNSFSPQSSKDSLSVLNSPIFAHMENQPSTACKRKFSPDLEIYSPIENCDMDQSQEFLQFSVLSSYQKAIVNTRLGLGFLTIFVSFIIYIKFCFCSDVTDRDMSITLNDSLVSYLDDSTLDKDASFLKCLTNSDKSNSLLMRKSGVKRQRQQVTLSPVKLQVVPHKLYSV